MCGRRTLSWLCAVTFVGSFLLVVSSSSLAFRTVEAEVSDAARTALSEFASSRGGRDGREAEAARSGSVERLEGGDEVFSYSQFPSVAAIFGSVLGRYQMVCNAVVLDASLVLAPASCLLAVPTGASIGVCVGVRDLKFLSGCVLVAQFVVPEAFDRTAFIAGANLAVARTEFPVADPDRGVHPAPIDPRPPALDFFQTTVGYANFPRPRDFREPEDERNGRLFALRSLLLRPQFCRALRYYGLEEDEGGEGSRFLCAKGIPRTGPPGDGPCTYDLGAALFARNFTDSRQNALLGVLAYVPATADESSCLPDMEQIYMSMSAPEHILLLKGAAETLGGGLTFLGEAAASAEPTPTPTPQATEAPTASPTPTPSAPQATETPTPTPTPTQVTETPTASSTPSPTPPQATETPTVSSMPTPTAPTPSSSPSPSPPPSLGGETETETEMETETVTETMMEIATESETDGVLPLPSPSEDGGKETPTEAEESPTAVPRGPLPTASATPTPSRSATPVPTETDAVLPVPNPSEDDGEETPTETEESPPTVPREPLPTATPTPTEADLTTPTPTLSPTEVPRNTSCGRAVINFCAQVDGIDAGDCIGSATASGACCDDLPLVVACLDREMETCADPRITDLVTDARLAVERCTSAPNGVDGGDDDDGDGALCFPAAAVVTTAGGDATRMDHLRAGDRILVAADGTVSDVFGFSHRLEAAVAPFVRIEGGDGVFLELSAGHYLPIGDNDRLKTADAVQLGDQVLLRNGSLVAVTALHRVHRRGVYHPHTLHGGIVVNDVVASTYTRTVHPIVAHRLLAVPRTLYRLGLKEPLGSLLYASVPTWLRQLLAAGPSHL